MNKYQLLRFRAVEFRAVLEEYAKKDKDVEWFLGRWMPWYERIQRKEIRLPCYEYKLNRYFFNSEANPNLMIRYVAEYRKDFGWKELDHPLGEAASNFSTAIRDDLSDPAYLERRTKAGELPDLIPHEPPPPEEETLLAEPIKEPAKQGWLKAFILGRK